MTWIQDWLDVLFLHFPAQADEVRKALPKHVEIDTFAGQAWISYVFFRLKLRPAWLPFVPGFSSLLELNVRTYVRHNGQPGIYFLRMYADNRLAIRAAGLLTPLCYEPATMIDEQATSGTRHIECRPAKPNAGKLAVEYAIDGRPAATEAESIDAWLLERYTLFVGRRGGGILAAVAEHPPWIASSVAGTTLKHTLAQNLHFSLDSKPALMHHSPGVTARFSAFRAANSPCVSHLDRWPAQLTA